MLTFENYCNTGHTLIISDIMKVWMLENWTKEKYSNSYYKSSWDQHFYTSWKWFLTNNYTPASQVFKIQIHLFRSSGLSKYRTISRKVIKVSYSQHLYTYWLDKPICYVILKNGLQKKKTNKQWNSCLYGIFETFMVMFCKKKKISLKKSQNWENALTFWHDLDLKSQF